MKTLRFVSSCALLGSICLPAHAQQIGFPERFALAEDREAVLKELIPGTDDHFYYTALHLQHQQKIGEIAAWVELWKSRFPDENARRNQITVRQALINYSVSPQNTLAFLRDRLDLRYPHERVIANQKPDLPVKLDGGIISWDSFARANIDTGDNLSNVQLAAFPRLLANWKKLTAGQLRDLLGRVERPDVPGLLEAIHAELGMEHSRGFGAFPVQTQLFAEQLDELLKLRPALLQSQAYVLTYLTRLAPAFGEDADRDPKVREAWLDRVEKFASTLPPVFNSLKAHILFHRLRHERKLGHADAARLLAYLQLPRPVGYVHPKWQERDEKLWRHPVDLNADFRQVINCAPVGNDESLVRSLLLEILAADPDTVKWGPYLNQQWLQQTLAEARLVSGAKDAAKYTQFLPPQTYQELRDRTDLDFDPACHEEFAPGDEVSLDLHVKNVPRLLVKVFEINSENVHRATGRQINTDLDLDGLVANREQTHDSDESPLLRVKKAFKFPELTGKRGVWVIEFIGGGKSSRALVRKGALRAIARPTSGGTLINVFDENAQPVKSAWVLMGTKRIDADKDGDILAPFSTQPGPQDVILGDASGFTSLEKLSIAGETYQLEAGMHVARESLLPGATAGLVIRPVLLANGRPVSAGALEKVKVTITSTTLEGISSTAVLPVEKVPETEEMIAPFSVPDRLKNLNFVLEAEVKSLITGQPVKVQASYGLAVNGITVTENTSDLYLSKMSGQYVLQELGRTGEAKQDRAVNFLFTRKEFARGINAALKTDESGSIVLGPLDGISQMTATSAAGLTRTFTLTADRITLPAAIHTAASDTVRIPWPWGGGKVTPEDVSLYEVRSGSPQRNVLSAASLEPGFLVVKGLAPGDYRLLVRQGEPASTVLRIAQGIISGDQLMTPGLTMELSSAQGVSVLDPVEKEMEVEVEDGDKKDADGKPLMKTEKIKALTWRIDNAGHAARVHIFASRFMPETDAFDDLSSDFHPAPEAQFTPWRPSLYLNARTIGEEYRYVLERRNQPHWPGNMLPRPGLLLNPWAISDTATDKQNAASGENAEPMVAERPGAAAGGGDRAKKSGPGQSRLNIEPDLSFLAGSAPVALNLLPDADGTVHIDLAMLGDRQFVRVVALNDTSAVVRDFSRPAPALKRRDLRLAGGLDPQGHFTQQNSTTLLEKDAPFTLAGAQSSQFQSVGSLGSAHQLLYTLSGGNPDIAEFAWILDWPKLDEAKRREQYSKHACHELNFFLAHKDPGFFKAVVQPWLSNKKEKTFLDEYLIGADLSGHLRPWQYSRLNAVERILLAQRIVNEQKNTARSLNDWLSTIPRNAQFDSMLFETALRGRSLVSSVSGVLTTGGVVMNGRGFGGGIGGGGGIANGLGRGTWLASLDDSAADFSGTVRFAVPESAAAAPPAPGAAGQPMGEMKELNAPAELAVDALQDAESGKRDTAEGGRAFRRQAGAKGFGDRLGEARKSESLAKDAKFRGRAVSGQDQFFRQIEKTREWAENNYWHLLIAQQNAALVDVNRFWVDYALWDGKSPFISKNLPDAAGNFSEAMLALAVLDLPFPSEAKAGKSEMKDNTLTLTPGGRGILFHQEIKPATVDNNGPKLLVSQNFYRQGDRYVEANGEKSDKFVTGEFLTGTVYGCQVVVTNPTSSRQKLELIFQVPQGAMPVLASRLIQNLPVLLEPFHTQTFDFSFYFPEAGKFAHYPVHVSRDAKVVAWADAFRFNVVDTLTKPDTASWDYVSQNGSDQEVMLFLDQANLLQIDLDRIAWRMKNLDFHRKVVSALSTRHVYHPTTWSYALLHNEPEVINAYLMHADGLLAQCGQYLQSPLVTVDPVERRTHQMLEYSPLINARAHRLGKERTILNDKFRGQYLALINILCLRPKLDDEDRLTVVYYQLLQDRIEEGLALLARVDQTKIAERLQYDYLAAWAAFCRADLAAARQIAARYADYPVNRWREKFAEVASQLDEIEGKAATPAKPEDRDQRTDRAAEAETQFAFHIESRQVQISYRNVKQVTVNYYPMDLEFLFSANPFVTQDTSRFRNIRPHRSEVVTLPEGKDTHAFPLPEDYASANVLVEITAAGRTRAEAAYANQLDVQFSENFGRLQVRHAGDKRPLSKVYVKVFATNGGAPAFYKDGYTDLRGRFDYASISTSDLDGAQKFSVLVLSDEFGAVVREVQPPAR